jgi:hypothetical protein
MFIDTNDEEQEAVSNAIDGIKAGNAEGIKPVLYKVPIHKRGFVSYLMLRW